MTWEKLPAIQGSVACLTCGCGAHDTLPMDALVMVGFGNAGYTRDGETLWCEDMNAPDDATNDAEAQVSYVESLAKLQPDHDWRVFYYAPLYEAVYQRQGDEHWVLIKKGDGFA